MLRTAAVAAAICGTAAATSSSTTPSSAFVSSMPLAQSGRVAACTRSGGVRTMRSMAEGFGKDGKKSDKPNESFSEGEASTEDDIRKIMGTGGSSAGQGFSKFEGSETVPDAEARRQAVSGRKRADPVNVDGGAAFDVGWIKKAADTVLSEEWAKAEKKGSDTAACAECGGTGRLQGGLGVLPGLQWWPIKAFRPCPTCEAAGRTYNRRGQGLDEVLFGKDDMPMDYKKPADVGGLSSADVKKIMAKTERKARKGKGK